MWLGAFFGAGLGFIIANVPGLLVGGYAGNRLGAIRDAKGKSVAAVFTSLGGSQKAEVSLPLYYSDFERILMKWFLCTLDIESSCNEGLRHRVGFVVSSVRNL